MTSGTPGAAAPTGRGSRPPPRASSEIARRGRRRSIERPTLTAWTTARLMPGTGTMTRSSRCGARTTRSGRDGELAARGAYWRLMNSIIATRIGITITTRTRRRRTSRRGRRRRRRRSARAPKALIAEPPAASRRSAPRASGGPCPIWPIVKATNTPTAYSGIRALVMPPKATSRLIAAIAAA